MYSKLVAVVPVLLFALGVAHAQAPSGSTGECKDGTYSTADSKRGACRGHGGVKTWYSESKSGASKAEAKAGTEKSTSKAEANTTTAKSDSKSDSKGSVAAGGGKGQVWVNTSTHVYHCEGDRYYGKTKHGEYMSEADAKTHGARAARGKACG